MTQAGYRVSPGRTLCSGFEFLVFRSYEISSVYRSVKCALDCITFAVVFQFWEVNPWLYE
jgi:hypothetical protein